MTGGVLVARAVLATGALLCVTVPVARGRVVVEVEEAIGTLGAVVDVTATVEVLAMVAVATGITVGATPAVAAEIVVGVTETVEIEVAILVGGAILVDVVELIGYSRGGVLGVTGFLGGVVGVGFAAVRGVGVLGRERGVAGGSAAPTIAVAAVLLERLAGCFLRFLPRPLRCC